MQADQLILCGGLPLPKASPGMDNALPLNLWGKQANIKLEIGDIHGPLWKNVPPIFHDLVEIATYVYVADQTAKRIYQDTDTFGGAWSRSLHYHIPVRCPEQWNSPEINRQLRETLEFLSDDNITFTFYPAHKPQEFQLYLDGAPEDIKQPDQVIMFSGGLDSLAGVVDEAVVNKNNVLLVNHRSTPKRNSRMRALETALARHAGQYRPSLLAVRVSKDQDLTKDYTQRARSFLYASLGATVSHILGLSNLRFYENGVVSLNLPICAQVVGSRATRTTHPRVLNDYSKLFSLLAGHSFKVENPFIWLTKGDTVRAIMKADCSDLIGLSTSCAHTWTTSNVHPHCGTCSQCIDRRLATVATGADELDPVAGYKVDIFTQSRSNDDDKMMVAYFLERANQVGAMTDVLKFISAYPTLTQALPYFGIKQTAAAERVLELYKRHAKEVSGAVDIMTTRCAPALRQRTLPGDCMVRLVLDPNAATMTPVPASLSPNQSASTAAPEHEFGPSLTRLEAKMDAIGVGYSALRDENAELKKSAISTLTALAKQVPPQDFAIFAAVLAGGNISAAARLLKRPDSTVRTIIEGWPSRGPAFGLMADLVGWRKSVGRKITTSFDERWINGEAVPDATTPDLVTELLDAAQSQNASNWPSVKAELVTLLKQLRDS